MLKLIGSASDIKPTGTLDDQRVKLVPLSIETCFGYWVPYAYHRLLNKKIDSSVEMKASRLMMQGRNLNATSDDTIINNLRGEYFSKISERLEQISTPGLTPTQRQEVERRVIRKITTLRKKLSNDEECKRLARPLSGKPVPELWEDPRSKKEMVESFCEYVSWKLGGSSRVPKIVNVLKVQFGLSAGDDYQDVLEKIHAYFRSGRTISRQVWDSD